MATASKSVADFAELVSGTDAPILVGGQAVNLWCLLSPSLHAEVGEELKQYSPFLSKDCDVIGDRDLLHALAAKTKLVAKDFKFGQPTSCIGFLYAANDPEKTPIIEVLHKVHGLTPKEIGAGLPVEWDGNNYRTISPPQLLKAKLANAAEIPQVGRQDVRHVQMLIPCVRAYITYAHRQAEEGAETVGFMKKMLTRCLQTVNSSHGAFVEQQHGINLRKCFPEELLRESPFQQVQNFWQHQLAK